MTHLIFLFKIIFTCICDIKTCLHANINLHGGLILKVRLKRIIIYIITHVVIHNMIIIENNVITTIATVSTGELFTLVQNINNSDYSTMTYYYYSLYTVWLVIEIIMLMM